MQDQKDTLNSIDQNTELALLQSEKIANSVDNLEPIMEGVLLKTDEVVQELKKKQAGPKLNISGSEVVTLRGKDGKDGKDGEKGEKGDRGEKGEKGDKGEKGEPGRDGIDGMPGNNGFDGKNGMPGLPGKPGKDGKDGKDGRDGIDGSPDTGEQIKEKLESLKVGLDYEKLSNTPDISKIVRAASSKTVSLIELDDVDYSSLTQTNGKYVLGSSSLTSVSHDNTLTGEGTVGSPLSVVDSPVTNIISVYKSADETINNSSTLQNDDDLVFALGANEKWSFKVTLFFTSGATPDIKFKFTVPSGAEMKYMAVIGSFAVACTESTTVINSGGSSMRVEILEGIVTTSSTAGNIQLQWAQNTQDLSDTVVKAGSFIFANKIS